MRILRALGKIIQRSYLDPAPELKGVTGSSLGNDARFFRVAMTMTKTSVAAKV